MLISSFVGWHCGARALRTYRVLCPCVSVLFTFHNPVLHFHNCVQDVLILVPGTTFLAACTSAACGAFRRNSSHPLLSGVMRAQKSPAREAARWRFLYARLRIELGCREHLWPKVHDMSAALRALTCAVSMAEALPTAAEAAIAAYMRSRCSDELCSRKRE